MVCAYAFAPGGPGRAVDHREAVSLLARQASGPNSCGCISAWRTRHQNAGFVSTPAFLRPLRAARSSSTRLEVVDDAVMGVVNDVQVFGGEASSASTMTLHVGPRLVVTQDNSAPCG